MKKEIFKLLAKINKAILPSFTKKRLDLAKASKIQRKNSITKTLFNFYLVSKLFSSGK